MTGPAGRTAIVVGGGIAGLTAAIALRRAGYDVAIRERAERIEPLGAALSLWPNAVEALRRLGAAEQIEAQAAPIETMLLATSDGTPLIGPRVVRDRPRDGARAYLPTRSLLQAALRAAAGDIPLHLGSGVAGLVQDDQGVSVTLANGEIVRAGLAILADGIWSESASSIVGTRPHHCGYGGVVALSDEAGDSETAGLLAEYWGNRERFGVGDIGGGRRYWFYMADERSSSDGIALTHAHIAARAAGWPAPVLGALAATPTSRLIPFSIHARPIPRRLGAGRIIVVGDAAHAMEPNLGQGACQAIEDGAALCVAALGREPIDVLPRFEAIRGRRVATFVRQSARARLGAHGSPVVRTAVRWGCQLVPQGMHERMIGASHHLAVH